jgi:toxin ParE1/3/4
MARFRVSHPARTDIDDILATSASLWGTEAKRRYTALLQLGMQRVADQPDGPLTRDRSAVRPGVRSFHLRHARRVQFTSGVKQPVHILYYRVVRPDIVEILRVLHERMEASRHLGMENGDEG